MIPARTNRATTTTGTTTAIAVFGPVPSPPEFLAVLTSARPGAAVPVVEGSAVVESPTFVTWAGGGVDTTVTTITEGVTTSPGTVALGVTTLVMICVEGACAEAVMTEVATLAADDGSGAGVDDGSTTSEDDGGGAAEEEGITMGVELGSSDDGASAEEDGVNEGVGVADGSGTEVGAADEAGSVETIVGGALDEGADEGAREVSDDAKREDVPAEVPLEAIVMAETKRSG
jgi:hypothetical protein